MKGSEENTLLWQRFRKGDIQAFEQFFRLYYQQLFQYGSRLSRDSQLIEDAIQEVFVSIWQSKSPPPAISMNSYLLKALKYTLVKSVRAVASKVEVDESMAFDLGCDDLLVAREDDHEKKQRIDAALNSLPLRQKEIIYLRFYQDLSYEEIASIMDLNYQTARNLLHQAIKTLRKMAIWV